MSPEGSVTEWLNQLQAGNSAWAQLLWERFFTRLVALARTKLRQFPRRVADEEDVVLSAFDTFCRGAEAGRFPQLQDRDNLWRFLVALTIQKAAHLVRAESRHKRGGGAVLDEAGLHNNPGPFREKMVLEQIAGREPTPEFAAQVTEECAHLLGKLADADLQSVALWKMEGFTNEEIAGKLGCGLRSVERKLRLIRNIWEKEPAL